MKRTNLKIKIIENNLTQKELAKRIGVSSQAITDYINGNYNPKFEVMQKIAAELNSTVDELFFTRS